MKKALLLCASHNDFGLIRALRKLNYYIIVTGNIESLPGIKYCDRYIKADYSDKELILAIAQKYKIDAIVQCCNDFGVYTATYVAEKMGLPGYDSYETCLLLHNKDKFKEFALKNCISTPKSFAFTDENKAYEYLSKQTGTLIVKPVDCSAGNGISKITDINSGRVAIRNAFNKSRSHRIVVEPFISGTQHGFCTFLQNKKVVQVCSNNEYSFLNPYRVEIDTFPANNYEIVKKQLIDEIEKIANLLNLNNGIFHLQYIFDGKKIHIIEVMRRILGNMYHVPGNLLSNLDWEYWETRAKCGLDCREISNINRQEGFFAYKTILSNDNGRIRDIKIPDLYDKYKIGEYFLKSNGDFIDNYKNTPIGFLFFMFPSENKMKEVLIDKYESNFVELE